MREFLRKRREWVFGPNNSLRNKIIRDTFKYFLLYFLIFEIILILYYYLTNQDIENIIAVFKGNIVAATITFFIIILSFKKTLQKHVYSRFETIQNDLKKIKKGDFSKRIKLHSKDEFDQVVFFANSLLDEVEKKIEFEKKYSLMDPLTLTYNRRALNLTFSKFASRAKRGEKIPLSLFLLDIDHFKSLNDTHGHKIGDEVLKELTKLIKRILRKDDNLYRVGGEEFIILFFKLAKNKEKKLIERLQTEITYNLRKKFPIVDKKITISGGFVRSNKYNISDQDEFTKMIDNADTLLYKAKNSGRNKVIFQK